MQKKLIALAVAGLMSGAAFAQTSVTVGGKFDASYQFKRTADVDQADGSCAAKGCYKTTETQGDGGNSTSRISIGAKETIAPGYEARIDLDIRFGNIHEGKGFSEDANNKIATTGGLNANDKKAMAFTTPFGTLQWGVASLMSNDYKLAEKPYMVTPKDTEIVKYGVSQLREESLTSRNTSYWSPVLNLGPVKTLIKGTFAFGDNQKSGANDANGASSGNVFVIGNEGVVMDGIADWGLDYTRRDPSGTSGNDSYVASVACVPKAGGTVAAPTIVSTCSNAYTAGSMIFTHAYVNLRPIPGNKNLKISVGYNHYSGWNGYEGGSFEEKNSNLVVSYNFNDKAEIGLGLSRLSDMGSNRNSGTGIMLGGSYFVSKSVQLYAGLQKTNFERNEKITGGKYSGISTATQADLSKVDDRYVRVGIMKEF